MANSITPSKRYVAIEFTPTTKKLVCVLCGKKEDKDSYRVKLFKNDKKTEACCLIEKYLDVEISADQTVNSVCQNCYRSLSTIQSKLHVHKQNYEKTVAKLKESHGRVSKKRRSFSDLPALDPKRQTVNYATPNRTEADNSATDNEESIRKAVDLVTDRIQKEIKSFCSKQNETILRTKSEEILESLSWSQISEEFKTKTPIFWQVIEKCAQNPRQKTLNVRKTEESYIPGLSSAACKLISLHNRQMDAVQQLNSLILLKSGAKKSAFRRLNATQDCLGYKATLQMADNFGSMWEKDLLSWVEAADQDRTIEKQYVREIEQLDEDAIFIDDPVESVANLFRTENAKADLSSHRANMQKRYYFVGDNVDLRTKVRQMTIQNQNKDQHMYQICAYKNRISGNELYNSTNKGCIDTVLFKELLPSNAEKEKLLEDLSFLVAKQWTEDIPYFGPYNAVLPKYIEHRYIKETRQKTERINMGVLKKNEQYNEDMTDICSFLNQYVPGARGEDDDRKQEKILSGGDYLTFERHKQAQSAKRNGRTPMKRMEGLVPKMEEFHNQAEFLQVVWKILYSTSSSKDTGTLYAARNSINAKNVSKDPGSNYYASSELLNKYCRAYIVCAGLKHFGMENAESAPNENTFDGNIGNTTEMKEYIMENAKSVVTTYTMLDFPQIPENGYQSNTILCEICGKQYKQAKTLDKHKVEKHGFEPEFRKEPLQHTPKDDYVLNYSKVSLTLCLLKFDHDNAIQMGDGERILNLDKVFCMFYKAFGCSKYAYGILETVLQTNVLLSERDAHRLVWNRTVNHKGQIDSNHPNDLDIEHCNKVFKDEAHSYRGVYTEKVISRVRRSALKTEAVLKNFDKISGVVRLSGKHTPGDVKCDVTALVQQFHVENLFDCIPGRKHSVFPDFKSDQLSLDMNDFRDWMSRSMKKFSKKHFYKY